MIFTGSELIEHHDKLMAYAYKRADNRDIAQDFVQTTYMRAIRSQHTYDPDQDSSLGAWLMTILKNVINDYWIEQNRLKRPKIDDKPIEDLHESYHPATIDSYDFGNDFEDERLEEAYSNLIPSHKEVIEFTYVQELTDEELVAKYGKDKQHYRSRRHKATRTLRKTLKATA